ncbi:DNA polymerase epsilon subunit 2, partial [Ascosphaera acerosa]
MAPERLPPGGRNRLAQLPVADDSTAFSSSPGFATPAHAVLPRPGARVDAKLASDAAAAPPSSPTPSALPAPLAPSTTAGGGGGGVAPRRQSAPLPVLLAPALLRPIAFRVLTKKHNLTISAATLQALAAFVGKHCGAGWRDGSAERVLEKVARAWKANGYGAIVEEGGEKRQLSAILKALGGAGARDGRSSCR